MQHHERDGMWGGVSPQGRIAIRRKQRRVLMTMTQNPERARRVADLWTRQPSLTEAEVTAQVDAELAAEAAQQAEDRKWADEMSESYKRLTSCSVCRSESKTYRSTDGLGDACRGVVAMIRAERRATEMVGDVTRRELAEAWLDRTAS
jgi:TorA maturation chaperone TorD